jgi:hypothetical protein
MRMPGLEGEASLYRSGAPYIVTSVRDHTRKGDVLPQFPPGGCHPGLSACSPDGWKTLWHADCTSEQIRCKWICSS